MSSSSQLSPRILSAYERLDTALVRLKDVMDKQNKKVDASVVEDLQIQIDTLTAQNNNLINDLDQVSSDDLEGKCSTLREENDVLRQNIENLETEQIQLKELNTDISARVQKLIGTVQQVLEEE